MLKRNGKQLRHSSQLLSTGAEAKAKSAIHFHQQMIMLGFEALHRFPCEERDIFSVTLDISDSL